METSSPIVQPSRPIGQAALQSAVASEAAFVPNRYWSDGEVRVSGREYNGLIDSPCYQRGNLSCFSCHSLHASDPDDQLAAAREGNEACLQCHQDLRNRIPAHTHHTAGSSGGDCYNCHMPYTTYGLLKGIRSHRISSPNISTNLATGRPNACNLCHMDKSLEWAALKLHDWFGQPMPAFTAEQRQTSALVAWLLRGDAGQRALAAYSAGWEESKRASGDAWLAPVLAPLLNDPYPSVRYIAARSLKKLPGFESFPYDFVGEPASRTDASLRATTVWQQRRQTVTNSGLAELLIDAHGQLDASRFTQLLQQRDDHSMDLQE